ncbi:MAG: STAS domain-containing protein [Alphaproteobacteria bacterium]
MEIGERREGGVVILSPVGRIDNDTSPAFQSKLLATVPAGGGAVLVDLSKVAYLSSAGLRALMMGAKQSKASNGRLAVAELKPVVKEIFTISRFAYVVEVFGTLAEALQALSGSSGAPKG